MPHPQSPPAIGTRLAASFASLFSKPPAPDAQWASKSTSKNTPEAQWPSKGANKNAPDAQWASEGANKNPPASTKSSLTGPLIALQSLRQPVWSPRETQAFIREGFMHNAIVYRCVRMIAEAAASVPLLLYSGDDEIETHPRLNLFRRPNPLQTGPDLLESVFGHLLVSGNAYIEAVSIAPDAQWASEGANRSAPDAPWASEGANKNAPDAPSIRELHSLRPDRMKIIPGPDGWPEAYEYTVGGRSIRIAAGKRRHRHRPAQHRSPLE